MKKEIVGIEEDKEMKNTKACPKCRGCREYIDGCCPGKEILMSICSKYAPGKFQIQKEKRGAE